MSNPKILYQDLSLIQPSIQYENPLFPITNWLNYEPNEVWKSDSFNTQYCDIENTVTANRSAIAIVKHNLPGLCTVGPTSRPLSLSSSVESTFIVPNPLLSEKLPVVSTIWYREFTPTDHRFFRFTFHGNASLDEYPFVGNMIIGKLIEFESPQEFNYLNEDEYETIEEETLNGSRKSCQLIGPRNVFSLNFRIQNQETRNSLIEFLQVVRGSYRPFVFIDSESKPFYVNLIDDNFDVNTMSYHRQDFQINLREHSSR